MWHLEINGAVRGPLSDVEVMGLIRAGLVTRETLVWRAGMEEWLPAGHTSLASHLHTIPPPVRKQQEPVQSTQSQLVNQSLPQQKVTENKSKTTTHFRSPIALTRCLAFCLAISLLLAVIAICTDFAEAGLLERLSRGENVGAGTSAAYRQIGFLQIGAYLVTAIFFCAWILRVARNIRRLGAEGLHFTPGWALGWYFVPIMSFWKPYQAMKEIWGASCAPADWKKQRITSLLPLWWACWVSHMLFGNAAARADATSKTPVEQINAVYMHLLNDAINVLLCGSLFLLVRQIALNQVRASTRSQVLPAGTTPTIKPPRRTADAMISQSRMVGWRIVIAGIAGLLILGFVLGVFLSGGGNTHRIVETEQSRKRSDRVIASPVGSAPKITATPSPVLSVAQERNPSASEIAKNTFPSVVLVATEDARGQPLAFGTGFFVGTQVVATNFHVVENAGSAYAKIVGKSAKIPIDGLVGLDAVHDLALLHVLNSGAPLLRIANEDLVAVGDQIFTIGNPRGLEGTFSEGIVSSRRRFGHDELLQITAPISPGSSGGPVLDRTGKVIGVAVASITNGQNLNFAIPATNVKALLGSKTEVRPLTSIPRIKLRSTIFGEQSIRKGAVGENLSFDGTSVQTGEFSFSLHNLMAEPVRNVYGIIIFCDVRGQPIDTYSIYYPSIIPPRLAKRLQGQVDVSVERLNCPVRPFPYVPEPPRPPKGPVEFRILDFEIVNN